jgi:hypothetical protein
MMAVNLNLLNDFFYEEIQLVAVISDSFYFSRFGSFFWTDDASNLLAQFILRNLLPIRKKN